jgi:hypothetical protein
VKILALRVSAFRRFAGGAAIEALRDGVNVLGGPNEMGKSTFFHALEAAFLLRHKVSGAALDGMRPYAGGEPLVEVDFEADGQRWRIRKQFGRGASAVLSDLQSGAIVARNAEADERLATLSGRSGDLPGGIGLVWVRQQRTLLPPDPDLDPETGKEKARGERAVLRDVIGREIEAAASDDALQSVLDKTKSALDALLTPSRDKVKKDGPLYIAIQELTQAKEKRDEARTIVKAAEQRLAHIAEMTARLAELDNETVSAAVRGARLPELEDRRNGELAARSRLDVARAAMRAAEAEYAAACGTLASRQSQVVALEQKRTAFATAAGIAETIEALTTEIESDPALPTTIDRLTKLDNDRAIAEAELSGHAATVDIALTEGGKGKVRAGDDVLTDDRRFTVVEPLEIVIDGVAAIRVSTAHAARGAELRAATEDAAREISDTLNRLGVATIAEARERAAARAKKTTDVSAARMRLSDLAPRGVGGIAKEIADMEARLKADAEQSISEEQAERLKAAAIDVRATFAALSATAMPDDAFRRLEGEIDAARQADESRKTETARLKDALAHAKGAQQAIDDSGQAGELAAREGDFERAEAEERRLRHEAEALRLLERTLREIEGRAKSAYFAPISRRLGGYLERVFGASEVTFRDDFAIDAMLRQGMREKITALSDGTREQLAILVRLAFAEILAESGKAVPLVLDDPLVYADDARFAAVCRELSAASAIPQVILLTCRERAFEILPGHRLGVTEWRPER